MKNYFAQFESDTVLIPELCIETIVNEVVFEQTKNLKDEVRKQYLLSREKDLEKMLLEQLKAIYNHSPKFRKDLTKNNSRDMLFMFLKHWCGYWQDQSGWKATVSFDKAIDNFYKKVKNHEEQKEKTKK